MSGGKLEGVVGGWVGGRWEGTHPYGMKCMKLGPTSFMKKLGKMSANSMIWRKGRRRMGRGGWEENGGGG